LSEGREESRRRFGLEKHEWLTTRGITKFVVRVEAKRREVSMLALSINTNYSSDIAYYVRD
jgi:hypothetical protein